VSAKLGVADNFAVRPFIQFNNSNTSSLTAYGLSVTYNFNIPRSGLIPYAGIGYLGGSSTGQSSINAGIYGEFGADYHASEQVSLNAHYKTANYGGVNIGVGYRF
jgi:Outer membrane protein beta-barrel domain